MSKQNVVKTLVSYKVDFAYISAYSTDSANVNFGKFHSAYNPFTYENEQFIPTQYPSYLIDKATKNGCDLLTCDNEV